MWVMWYWQNSSTCASIKIKRYNSYVMKKTPNLRREILTRKPLFASCKSSSTENNIIPCIVDKVTSNKPTVVQPHPKRSKFDHFPSGTTRCEKRQEVSQSGVQIESGIHINQNSVNTEGSLNVKRKRSNKRSLSTDGDILEAKLLSVIDKNDNSTSMLIDLKETCTSDSFTSLFSSPASSTGTLEEAQQSSLQNSEVLSSQSVGNLNCSRDSFADLFDDDDIAEVDVSAIISSYNSQRKKEDGKQLHQDAYNQLKVESVSVTCGYLHTEEVPRTNNASSNPMQQVKTDHADNDCTGHNKDGIKNKDVEELFYGLPQSVGSLIKKHKGIEKLYDWQNDCLNLPAVQNKKSLIYSLPTSGGKTLVAEILIMKELLCCKKDAILILPFVSIVQEKVRDMSLFAVDLDFLVEEYAANKGKFPPRKRRKKKSLYIATIEKANGLVNSLIEENRISEVGLVVIDELHMLGEGGHRGATLEMCLAKILFCSGETQIIGMSATLNNICDLQKFLDADIYTNDFRPVELKEYIKVETEIYEIKNDKIGRQEEIPLRRSRKVNHQSTESSISIKDPDHLSVLVQEVIPKYSCLLFCATKIICENVAKLLARTLSGELKKHKVSEKHELLRAIKSNVDRICPVLRRVIPYGIAYHHGGLTMDERKLIEAAYSQGTLCLLTCTSTLAAGVNLPAKRVILRSPYIGRNVISRSQYKQMIGRAGRAGIDTSGESIMILDKRDKEKVMNLIKAPLESCHSSLLHSNGQGLRSLVLSLIGLKVCNSMGDLNRIISRTLFAVQNNVQEGKILWKKVDENVDALVKLKLVKKRESNEDEKTMTMLETTALGRAAFKGCVDVDRSSFIYDEVKRAQGSLVLTNDLHLLYLVTTPEMITDIRPNYQTYLQQVEKLDKGEQDACDFIGVSKACLASQVTFSGSIKNEAVVKRFYLTLMLYKIINGSSIWDVSEIFEQPRGFIQSLFTSSTSFASCLVHFTNELPEFQNVKLLLETIVDKLSYTAALELVPLMQIPGVKKNRAKQLFAAGYRNLQVLAQAEPEALVKQIEHLSRTQAILLVSSAKMMLKEKVEALEEEAENLRIKI